MLRKNSKGQVTIFVILGIILLIAGGTTIYLMTRDNPSQESDLERVIKDIPFAMQPVQNFVQDCVRSTAENGIKRMYSGGYIDASDETLSGKNFNQDKTEPTNADGLVSMTGEFIPYWNYMKSSNLCLENCQFDSHKPNLFKSDGEPSVEGQIDKYVERELAECINNFEAFENFEVVSIGEIKSDTFVMENDVEIAIEYPIVLEQDGQVYNLEEFFTTVDFNIHKTYDLAEAMVQYELENSYLERGTMNWIAGFSGIDFNKFPPMFASDIDCETYAFWIEEEVQFNKLNPMLAAYVPSFQPVGITNQIDFGQMNPMQQGLYSQSLIVTDAALAEGLEVTHDYLEWPSYLNIHTSNGGLLEPTITSVDMILYEYCNAEYKFAYDISYPVLVEVTDPEAFNGEGFTLQFALETNIRRNEPAQTSDVQELAQQMPTFYEESLLCKTNQRTSGDITIEAFDGRNQQPLDDVMVRYCVQDADGSCGDDMCYLGKTKGGKLVTKMPPGQGLVLLTKKPTYKDVGAIFATSEGKKGELKVQLEPYRTINVSLNKKMLKKHCESDVNISILKTLTPVAIGALINPASLVVGVVMGASRGIEEGQVCMWDFDNNDVRVLNETEQAIIFFKRMDSSYKKVTANAFLSADAPSQQIELVPGNYKVEIMVTTDEKVIIPEDEMCFEDDWYDHIGLGTDECETLNEVEMNGTILGGARFNKETGGYIQITSADLNNDEIIMYSVSPEVKDIYKHDDLKLLGLTANYTKELRDDLLPEYK